MGKVTEMRTIVRKAFVILAIIGVTSCTNDKKAIGEPCVVDRECDNGFCLDLSVVDGRCRGRVCTRGCQQDGDCPQPPAGPDCRAFGGRSFCYYSSWEEEHCTAVKHHR